MTRTTAGALALALSLALLLTLGGCDSTAPDEEEPAEESEPAEDAEEEPEGATEEFDYALIDGTWAVGSEITHIDNEAMRNSAVLPGTEWTCAVTEPTMTLAIGPRVYEGELMTTDTGGWSFYGTSQYRDDAGVNWTSWILVETSEADVESFTGTVQGNMTSSTEGSLYIAEWNVTGEKQ